MRRWSLLVKSIAIISSFGLIGIYVYDQAGGDVLPWTKPSQSTAPKRVMPGSKSKSLVIELQTAPPSAASPKLLPGSKYIPLVDPNAPAAHDRLMPGSKGAIILPATKKSANAAPSETKSRPPTTHKRVMLPGSKSDRIDLSPPTKAAPVPSANRRAIMHGSKSAAPLFDDERQSPPVSAQQTSQPRYERQQAETR